MTINNIPPPKPVGPLRSVELSGKLLPFTEKGPNGQPHYMMVPGSPHNYLPCFDTEKQLDTIMEKVGITNYVVKKIDDGVEFLESIPKEIKVALNFREVEGGKVRWTEIQRL